MSEAIRIERWVVAGCAALTAAAIAAPVAARAHIMFAGLAAIAPFVAVPWGARRLPAALDGAWGRHRMVGTLWVLLACLGVLQMGRLSAFMADARREWGATVPDPSATHHACLSAYVYAAELDRRGEKNLYDAHWYPIFDPPGPVCRLVETGIAGLAPWASDAYQYPPPFLLLPRAAIALTRSFDAIRAGWFLIQALLFVVGGLLLAAWVGGGEGLVVGMLLPAALVSIPTMLDFQFGQFHVMAMLLACGAIVAFHDRRAALGGGLLAGAILSKLFPAVLLLVLLARRDWRALAWTAGFGVAFGLLGLAILGPAPYAAFFGYQLPRIASGAAFEFTHLGQNAVFLASRNFSVTGVAEKLRLLGAPAAMLVAARAAAWTYTLALIPLALRVARVAPSRVGGLLAGLALLNLAALRSPLAPAFYVTAPVLWVLVLLATRVAGRPRFVFAIVAAWVVVVGPPPLPDRAELVIGLIAQAVAVGVNLAIVCWPVPPVARREVPEVVAVRYAAG